MRRCDYCGRYVDELLFRSLENGSDACLECVEAEQNYLEEKERDEEGSE